VGKTATLANLCRNGARFIADDMVFLTEAKEALSLPKPMFIYPYHEPLFPELFAGEHKRLVPVALTPATEVLRTAVRPLFTVSPALENWARRITPEHMKTPPGRALPGVEIADRTPVRLILRLERSEGAHAEIGAMDKGELVTGLVHEFFGEETALTGLSLPLATSSAGLYPLDHWLDHRRAALTPVVEEATVLRIQVPTFATSSSTSDLLRSVIRDELT
jgi:hypothetical protein